MSQKDYVGKGYASIGKRFAIKYLLYSKTAIEGIVCDDLLIVPLYFHCTQFSVPKVDDFDYKCLVVQVDEIGSINFEMPSMHCLLEYLRKNLSTNSDEIRLIRYSTVIEDIFDKIDESFIINLAEYDDSADTSLDLYNKYFLCSDGGVHCEFGNMSELHYSKWIIELVFVLDESSGMDKYIERYYKN